MADQIDLHGAEVLYLPDQAAPITIAPSSIVGLVGAATDAGGSIAARLAIGAGNAALTFTAAAAGAAGNTVALEIVRPNAASQALAVTVDGRAITVSLATDADGAVTTTGAELLAAWAAVPAAVALAAIANSAGSTGASVVSPVARTLLAGGEDEPFPLDKPVALTTAAAAAKLGTAGSLPAAIADVWRTAGRAGATIVVVRTADDTAAKVIGSRAARAAVAASLTVGANNAAVEFTADAVGAGGNDITVALVDPGGNNEALAVAVNGRAITVSLATSNAGAITTTGAQLVAAVNASAAAAALVAAANADGSTGAGVVAAAAGAPLTGGSDALPAGSGIYALLSAQALTGLKPRLIAAPALETTAAALALEAVADELRAIPVVTLDGDSYSEALASRASLAHAYAVWPKFRVFDSAAGTVVDRPAAALALGHIVRVDAEESFAASPSNRRLQDVTGTVVPIDWQIDSRDSTANLLSRAFIATAIRRDGGLHLWGNRLADGELITHRRVRHLIGEALLSFIVDYIDRNVDVPFVEHILNRMNTHLRSRTLAGIITGGRAWFDAEYNTADTLAANQITFSFDLGLHAVAEQLTFRQSVSGVYNAGIISQLTGA